MERAESLLIAVADALKAGLICPRSPVHHEIDFTGQCLNTLSQLNAISSVGGFSGVSRRDIHDR